MAKKPRPVGPCHICGKIDSLSFEHVPPEKAFNAEGVRVYQGLEAMLDADIFGGSTKARLERRGFGAYTLCEQCNNTTGSWYANAFITWCHYAMALLLRSGGKPTLTHLHHIFPLRVLKQVATMFFSINHTGFAQANPDLVRFVLNREWPYLPPKYRFWAFYNLGAPRRSAVSGIMEVELDELTDGIHSRGVRVLSELVHPPLGFVLTFDPKPPDARMVDITPFTGWRYNDYRSLALPLQALDTYTGFPADYRTKEEVFEQMAQSDELERRRRSRETPT